MNKYGKGYKQKKIIELGEKGELTFGDIRDLYGFSKAIDELEKLVELDLVSFDTDTISYDTDLEWKEGSK